MDLTIGLFVLLILLINLIVWVVHILRVRNGSIPDIRPHKGFEAIGDQVSRSVESGRRVHFGLGLGGLASAAAPASVAALSTLDYLSKSACAADVPPLVTSGDGTLMLAAQDSLLTGYRMAGRSHDYSSEQALFVSDSAFPLTYVAGASEAIGGGGVGSNLLLGRFGPELAIIAETGARSEMEQVIGTDDPAALGVAMAITDKLLIGEELFAAGTYLEGDALHQASLRAQDIMRLLVIAGILLAAIVNLAIG